MQEQQIKQVQTRDLKKKASQIPSLRNKISYTGTQQKSVCNKYFWSLTKHKPWKKDSTACTFSNACKILIFLQKLTTQSLSQSTLKLISNHSLTPDWMELLHLAEWLGLSYHPEIQPSNPYVPHRQHDKRRESMLSFLSCSDHPKQEFRLSGRGSRDKRDIGFARC